MPHETLAELPAAVVDGLRAGTLCPYLGPGMLALCAGPRPPADAAALAAALSARVAVPGRIRHQASATAQFIENFKHRKTLTAAMDAAFAAAPEPSPLHRWLASRPAPLLVDAWYDGTLRRALAGRDDWAEVQGLSQSQHAGRWSGWYGPDGAPCAEAAEVRTVLYAPWGARAPASNYLVSDADFVEVLTEIDIQTPIPEAVRQRRGTLGFVFLGCRFDDQLPRAFARQIAKRSAGPHFAVLADEPTRMERRFLDELGIVRIALPLDAVAATLVGAPLPA